MKVYLTANEESFLAILADILCLELVIGVALAQAREARFEFVDFATTVGKGLALMPTPVPALFYGARKTEGNLEYFDSSLKI